MDREKFPSSRFWNQVKKWPIAMVTCLVLSILLFGFFVLGALASSDLRVAFLGFILSFPFLFLFIVYFLSSKRVKKVIDDLSKEEAMAISLELDNEATIVKGNIFFTENYIVGAIGNYFVSTLDIIKYSDIIWVYIFPVDFYLIHSHCKILTQFEVVVYTKDYKEHRLASSAFEQKISFLADFILSKNPDMLSGYTSHNIEIINKRKEQDQAK